MKNEIKFIELLGKTGSQQRALFEVGTQEIIIGVGYSLWPVATVPESVFSGEGLFAKER